MGKNDEQEWMYGRDLDAEIGGEMPEDIIEEMKKHYQQAKDEFEDLFDSPEDF